MSHQPLREEKNCLNCGSTVKERFCPKCGQENIINRPSFHYLFSHFAEDFVHYDSGFWKTLKTLLFKPGRIIRDYLDGKRKTYMPPVKLYIFVSFLAFFIPYFLPDFESEKTEESSQNPLIETDKFPGVEVKNGVFADSVHQLDSIQNALPENQKIPDLEYNIYQRTLEGMERDSEEDDSVSLNNGNNSGGVFSKRGINLGPYKNVRTLEQLDSIDKTLSEKEKPSWASKKIIRKVVELRHRHYDKQENMWEKGWDTFVHNLPKALFFYLPVFALILWLVHSKKKWLYYDHGVFTLYYFSFLLVLITLNIILEWILSSLSLLIPALSTIFDFVDLVIVLICAAYAFFYFFRAHSTVYKENKVVSRTISTFLFFINIFVFFIVLMIYTLITFLII